MIQARDDGDLGQEAAVEVVRKDQIQDTFWKFHQQDPVMDGISGVREGGIKRS